MSACNSSRLLWQPEWNIVTNAKNLQRVGDHVDNYQGCELETHARILYKALSVPTRRLVELHTVHWLRDKVGLPISRHRDDFVNSSLRYAASCP